MVRANIQTRDLDSRSFVSLDSAAQSECGDLGGDAPTPELISRQHGQFLVLLDKRCSDISRIADISEESGFPGVLRAIQSKDAAVTVDVLQSFNIMKQNWGMEQIDLVLGVAGKLGKSKSGRCVAAAVAVMSAVLQKCGQTISQGVTAKVQMDVTEREACTSAYLKLETLFQSLSKYKAQFQDLMDIEFFLERMRPKVQGSPQKMFIQ